MRKTDLHGLPLCLGKPLKTEPFGPLASFMKATLAKPLPEFQRLTRAKYHGLWLGGVSARVCSESSLPGLQAPFLPFSSRGLLCMPVPSSLRSHTARPTMGDLVPSGLENELSGLVGDLTYQLG